MYIWWGVNAASRLTECDLYLSAGETPNEKATFAHIMTKKAYCGIL